MNRHAHNRPKRQRLTPGSAQVVVVAGIFPGLTIFIAALGFNRPCDALQDVLEPRFGGEPDGAVAI